METKQWPTRSFLKANLELFTQVMPTLSSPSGQSPSQKLRCPTLQMHLVMHKSACS